MADHLDAPGLQSPNMDPRIDITDIYIFQKPGDANKSILILNVNPLAPTLANSFEDRAVYEFKIDTNADAVADIAFRVIFSAFENGAQSATVKRATGESAAREGDDGTVIISNAPCSFGKEAHITTSGDYKFYAGFRSDPFFFDLVAFLNGFAFHNPGSDFFIDKNVFSIVLEVPNHALGENSKIGLWCRTLRRVGDQLTQDDRMGRPAINTVFNHGNAKNVFNAIDPPQDRAQFEASFVSTLTSFGYSTAQATAIAEILLPDILTFDYSNSGGFLNGRQLKDDVIDIELGLVTNGALTTDFVGPHIDYLSVFPYVGVPH
jgi:hypothetical protein